MRQSNGRFYIESSSAWTSGKRRLEVLLSTTKNRQKQVDADKKEISSYRKDLLEETKSLKNELKDRDSAIFNLHKERAHFSGVIARYEEQIKGLERDLKRLKNNDIQNKKHIEELLKKNG